MTGLAPSRHWHDVPVGHYSIGWSDPVTSLGRSDWTVSDEQDNADWSEYDKWFVNDGFVVFDLW